eukprot:gb/GFBE01067073.1/.p1 GENE.gb/GFBE01067073.1/~~gb/GFBE01067073.1/.p1  ORF type:complete len:347 (+),score=37.36 gb/GFBE01067073.1/:1-1041(+)
MTHLRPMQLQVAPPGRGLVIQYGRAGRDLFQAQSATQQDVPGKCTSSVSSLEKFNMRSLASTKWLAGACSEVLRALCCASHLRRSRKLRGKARRRSDAEEAGTYVPLGIETTSDVVQQRLHAVTLSAELLRGPGGVGEMSVKAQKVLKRAEDFCNTRLPQALRGHPLVQRILDLLSEALKMAGTSGSRSAFHALQTPLLSFHENAPADMRKALQARISGAAEKLLDARAPPEAQPLGTTLTVLAVAVRGPAGASKWKPPDVLQIDSESRWKMPRALRQAVLDRDCQTCWYCGAGDANTVDHWIPLCRGGTNTMVNLVSACSACNELKGNSMPDDFAATPSDAAGRV